ncbi:MBOAT family protein [Massilia sp. 9I]|uniref:MBOAT family O-acyltransferase n=1 Tax=Massilia sp. 9I TaxID=2653152 RepID=UPI0012EFF0E6|nr:MBOAT family O-acyltransferase [Massilia sp. 9I]VXC21838.1 putative Peptidoglycan O-acetyltransferase [Massilia sp. 9I]
MLFNSYSFIFVFLPLTVLGYMAINRFESRAASLGWLVACSLLFYGVWNPVNLAIILPSVAVNYVLALGIRAQLAYSTPRVRVANLLVAIGVVANLCFLGYFKYKNFFLGSINDLAGTQYALTSVILPLGISFITFQKIAFLADVRSGAIRDFDLFDFLIFVFFFPQLIAGPIVHYREMMPQFAKIESRLNPENVAVGLSIFAIGLFKKVVLADGIAPYVPATFTAAINGEPISFFQAWIGALAYTFQIYFDFSGYSDMAIGLARIFGIKLPMNFNSPLKASSIIEFWSRWHITLTRFLTAYVYTPIVMSLTRKRMAKGLPVIGRKRPTVGAFITLLAWPTIFTMFLSGFWHGAGYTFLAWGILHGVYLTINHAWRQWRPKWDKAAYERIMRPVGFVITFVAVVVGLVLFRATTIESAWRVLRGMAGLDGISVPLAILNRAGPIAQWVQNLGIGGDMTSGATFTAAVIWIVVLFLIATVMPNSLEIMQRYQPALYFEPKAKQPVAAASAASVSVRRPMVLTWNTRWAFIIAALFIFGTLGLSRPSEFLYWQF